MVRAVNYLYLRSAGRRADHAVPLLLCALVHMSHAFLDRRCYSCMSLDFKEKWTFLSEKYYPPANFTDACNEPMMANQVAVVPCRTACVMICEASYIGGQFAGYNYIRGCLNKIARNGLNNRTLYRMSAEKRDVCHRTSRSQLFNSQSYVEDQVTICVCHRNRCNSSKAFGSGSPGHRVAVCGLLALTIAHYVAWTLNV